MEGQRHRHLSIRSLALLAQRTGQVFASVRTWYALARANGWRRLRERQYPEKCRVGVRATAPNELWHIDVTIFRLLDGSRVYLHAVLDNFSRRILAFRVERALSAETTREMLLEARHRLGAETAKPVRVFTDGGSENVCLTSDAELATLVTRVIAQVEVSFSNSMIEAFWSALKHRWLYLHRLDTLDAVRRLVAEYVGDHNDLIPRVELGGRTPTEAYEGRPAPALEDACREARARRLEANRRSGLTCMGEKQCASESNQEPACRCSLLQHPRKGVAKRQGRGQGAEDFFLSRQGVFIEKKGPHFPGVEGNSVNEQGWARKQARGLRCQAAEPPVDVEIGITKPHVGVRVVESGEADFDNEVLVGCVQFFDIHRFSRVRLSNGV